MKIVGMTGCAVALSVSLLGLGLARDAVAAAPTELRVLLGVDPSDDTKGIELNPTIAPAATLTRSTGLRATITRTSNMGEAMRASRTLENEVLIGPAHVTASAILHAYTLVGTSGQQQTYALLVSDAIKDVAQLKGRRIYLPQQDSLRSYVAKGMLQESGIKLAQFGNVTYGNTSDGGLLAISLGMADVTIAEEAQAREWIAKHPGKARVLKTTRPLPGGANLVVRKDACERLCARLVAWMASPDGVIPGTGRFHAATASARGEFSYVASLGITTPEATPGATTVGAEQVAKLVGQRATIVDTRSAKEYDSEHLRGAINLPYIERSLKEIDFDATQDDFGALAKVTDKDGPVVFLCNGPECWKSYKASRAAVAAGYKAVYWFRGGMPAWREKNLPTEGAAALAAAR